MKKLPIILFVFGVSLATISCSKDEVINKDNATQKASISFEAILEDIKSSRLDSKQSLDELPECVDDDASYVRIILSRDGINVVGTQEEPFRIDLVSNQIFTKEVPELKLDPGNYSLDYFGVYNKSGELIWIAPNGSIFSDFFENPLPQSIELDAGVKKYVEVSVLCFENRFVNDFGYIFFDLDTNQAIEFCIYGNYCDETGRHYPAAFSVNIWSYSNGETGAQLFSNVGNTINLTEAGDYAATPLCFALPDAEGLDEYYIEISILNSDAYGDVTGEIIRSGVITDVDIKNLFYGDDTMDYFHFREGACNLNDSPELFDDGGLTDNYSNDVIISWNELLGQSLGEVLPQPVEAKIFAMVTLAIHDALNNIVPKYETYALDNSDVDVYDISETNIHSIADAAVSQAARDMMVQLFPDAITDADNLLNSILADIEDSELKIRGIEIGKAAAAAVLAKRANDFPLEFESYIGGSSPGEYRANYLPWSEPNPSPPPSWPANAVFAPNLGSLAPFGIKFGGQFRDEAPYPLNSSEYIADYNEVKALGCMDCPQRTEEQTEIGIFWVENTASFINRIARSLIVQKNLDGWDAARLIGLIQITQMDGFIASWEGKFFFDFWRPVTAIRAGDSDGVEATIGDTSWTTLVTTPPHSDFPSAHAYNGGAASSIFQLYFNQDQIDLTVTSPYYLPGVERHLSSFTEMSYEIGISRIYIGFHYRYAVIVGERQGKQLGEYVFNNNLKELNKNL